jgi:hypothetical protein
MEPFARLHVDIVVHALADFLGEALAAGYETFPTFAVEMLEVLLFQTVFD